MSIAAGGTCCNFLRRGRSANTFRHAAQASAFQNKAPVIRLCRKFSFEAICGLVSPAAPWEKEREGDNGGALQGGSCPPGDQSDGRALGCGLPLELSAYRSTHGGTGGAERPRDHPPWGRAIPSPGGGGVPPPAAGGVGQWAEGRDGPHEQRRVARSLACRR